jgi:hypothetical protein
MYINESGGDASMYRKALANITVLEPGEEPEGGNFPINTFKPNDVGGYDVRGQVRASYGSTGVLLDLNPVITSNVSGSIAININSYISADIPISDHVYDIERYPSGILTGNSIKLMRGKFSILPEVTR